MGILTEAVCWAKPMAVGLASAEMCRHWRGPQTPPGIFGGRPRLSKPVYGVGPLGLAQEGFVGLYPVCDERFHPVIPVLHGPIPGFVVEQHNGGNFLAALELAEVFAHSAPVMSFAAKHLPALGNVELQRHRPCPQIVVWIEGQREGCPRFVKLGEPPPRRSPFLPLPANAARRILCG